MQTGAQTPWGSAQSVHQLGDEVWMVSTASHGGVYVTGAAARAIPAAVRRTFINGANWAEEDCEACIAIAILEQKGHVAAGRLGGGVDKVRRMARATAGHFPRYRAALEHLPPASSERQAPAPAHAHPAA